MASLLSNDIKVEESFATLKVDLPILCKYPPFRARITLGSVELS